jgi:hypothetical protein
MEFYPNTKKSEPIQVGNDLLLIFDVELFDLILEVCKALVLERGPISTHGTPVFRAMTIRDVDGRRIRVREVDGTAPH